MRFVIFLGLSLFFLGCAGTAYEGRPEETSVFKIADISNGLPKEGLWRQNTALFDMNGDGFLDIIAPPPRLAKPEMKMPHLFLYDAGNGKWREEMNRFPAIKDYDYGSVAVGDLNRDGLQDIAFASHSKRIIILLNDGNGAFSEAAFPSGDEFPSRTLELADINGDGRLDLTAVSETPLEIKGVSKGILTGINRNGIEWDTNIIKEGERFFGNSLSVTDINGDGLGDIIIAPLTTIKADKKIIWLGDGAGNFRHHDTDFMGDMVPFIVKTGDIDGDGREEALFQLSGIGANSGTKIMAFKWEGDDMRGFAGQLPLTDTPVVFNLADIDNDGREEVIALSLDGLHIYKYNDGKWIGLMDYPLPPAETKGAFGLAISRQGDGSWLVVYNLGSETAGTDQGIKALKLIR